MASLHSPGRHMHRAVRCLLFSLVLCHGTSWAAETIEQQARRVETALARISQEQQAVYQQFQMMQQLRSNEERQQLPIPTYVPSPAAPERLSFPVYSVRRNAGSCSCRRVQSRMRPSSS